MRKDTWISWPVSKMKFSIGDQVRFNQDYFSGSPEMLSFIGVVLPFIDENTPIRILWETGEIEEYPEKFEYYLEIIQR